MSRLKTLVRDLLPSRLQVPVKYWYSRARDMLEPEMALLDRLVTPGDRVVDVGGNRGVYAYRLARLGAQVEVFEPNPACTSVLQAWAAHHPSVRVHAVALSSHEGTAALHIPVGAGGVEHDSSASLESGSGGSVRDQVVPLRRLDSFRFEQVKLIKIDVEGHEYGVLEGAAQTLSGSKPALLIEIEQRHLSRPIAEVFDKVRSAGYRGYFLERGALVPIERFDVAVHQDLARFARHEAYVNNFLFLHEERIRVGAYSSLLADSRQRA